MIEMSEKKTVYQHIAEVLDELEDETIPDDTAERRQRQLGLRIQFEIAKSLHKIVEYGIIAYDRA